MVAQAEEQIKLSKDRKKGEKIIIDSQEKAYWRVYRPPPGYTTVVESSPVPSREQRVKARNRTKEHLSEEVMKTILPLFCGYTGGKNSGKSADSASFLQVFCAETIY